MTKETVKEEKVVEKNDKEATSPNRIAMFVGSFLLVAVIAFLLGMQYGKNSKPSVVPLREQGRVRIMPPESQMDGREFFKRFQDEFNQQR